MKLTHKKIALILSVVVSLTTLPLISCDKGTSKTQKEETKATNSNKIIIAHRGASGYLPEHTLEAYSMAYAQGADYIEADVNITKDGIPIVMHDIHLDTNTNVNKIFPDRKREDGRYYIVDFTLDEIKQLSVSERIDLETGTVVFDKRFPAEKSHFEVPTLAEEIELIQGLNKSTGKNVGICPELKFPDFYTENGFDIGKITLDLLTEYGYNKEDALCYIQCFDSPYLKNFVEKSNPKCKIVQLVGDQSWDDCKNNDVAHMLSTEGLKEIAKYADVLSPSVEEIFDEKGEMKLSDQVLNENLVEDSHKANLEVYPYTVRKDSLPSYVNTVEDLISKLLFDANCDGLFTDFTDIGVKVKTEGKAQK